MHAVASRCLRKGPDTAVLLHGPTPWAAHPAARQAHTSHNGCDKRTQDSSAICIAMRTIPRDEALRAGAPMDTILQTRLAMQERSDVSGVGPKSCWRCRRCASRELSRGKVERQDASMHASGSAITRGPNQSASTLAVGACVWRRVRLCTCTAERCVRHAADRTIYLDFLGIRIVL